METTRNIILLIIISFLTSCGGSRTGPMQATEENFITLADVTGKTTFKEDSPDVRVIVVKAKAIIKKENLRAAKFKALEKAGIMAVDSMVHELMIAENYNRNYEAIENYFSKNINKYILDSHVDGEKKIYQDKFYGVSASFKISRQKVLVALQKDLQIIDTSGRGLVAVITSKKSLDLSAIGFRFSDLENALLNQIQTDLNQRGLKAIDFRNAIVSMQSDPKSKDLFSKVSKKQFMAMVAGTKAEDVLLDEHIKNAEEFYSVGLSLLKQLAKVVIEVNILSVSKTGNNMVLNLGVTAKNISVGTGGAFANAVIQVGHRADSETDDSAVLVGLIKDAYEDMDQEFIPQVIKEMSVIDAGSKKLTRYELVFKGFASKERRRIRQAIVNSQTDSLRYIDLDNTLRDVQPSIIRIFIRFAGNPTSLGDTILDIMESKGISAEEPIIAPGLSDLVFEKSVNSD
jgi:hypothetical protein